MTGGPGVGKSSFLRGLHAVLKPKWPSHGDVVIVTPTGSSAKTANGQTLHSFFGFARDYIVVGDDPAAEAARLVATPQVVSIRRRLAVVRILLLDEVSMVAADVMDVMLELLIQSRLKTAPLPTFYACLETSCSWGRCLAPLHSLAGRGLFCFGLQCWR